MSVKPETHLQITYWCVDVMAFAFIPVFSSRDRHQSGEKKAIIHIYGNYLGELGPRCSGFSAGALQTQTMIPPAAAEGRQSWDSH